MASAAGGGRRRGRHEKISEAPMDDFFLQSGAPANRRHSDLNDDDMMISCGHARTAQLMCQYHYTKAFEALAYVDTFAAWGDASLMFVVLEISRYLRYRDQPQESWPGCYDIRVNAISETLVSG